jgi:hypothetical protein
VTYVLWNSQALAHDLGQGIKQMHQGNLGDEPNIMGKGKAIP